MAPNVCCACVHVRVSICKEKTLHSITHRTASALHAPQIVPEFATPEAELQSLKRVRDDVERMKTSCTTKELKASFHDALNSLAKNAATAIASAKKHHGEVFAAGAAAVAKPGSHGGGRGCSSCGGRHRRSTTEAQRPRQPWHRREQCSSDSPSDSGGRRRRQVQGCITPANADTGSAGSTQQLGKVGLQCEY